MRDRVVRLGDADLRIRALADFARHHEREHARQVGLVGQRQQVEHQRRRAPRTTPARRPARSARRRRSAPAVSARWIRRSISRTCRGTRRAARGRAAPSPASRSCRSPATKSRMLRSVRIRASRSSGCAAAAEHPLEHHARIDLHRQRRRRRLPVERVHVGAAVAGIAGADESGEVFGRHLERRERRVLADLPRDDLIDRRRRRGSRGRRSASAARRSASDADARRGCCSTSARVRLLTTTSESRKGSSGLRIGVNSKPGPRPPASTGP